MERYRHAACEPGAEQCRQIDGFVGHSAKHGLARRDVVGNERARNRLRFALELVGGQEHATGTLDCACRAPVRRSPERGWCGLLERSWLKGRLLKGCSLKRCLLERCLLERPLLERPLLERCLQLSRQLCGHASAFGETGVAPGKGGLQAFAPGDLHKADLI